MYIGADLAAAGTTDKTVVFVDREGCGNPNCIPCRNSREGFARIKGWNQAKEEASMPSGSLANMLETKTMETFTREIDGYFDGQIKGKKQVLETLNRQIVDLTTRRNALKGELDVIENARKAVAAVVTTPPKERGSFYYFYSRSGESGGHYVERFAGGQTTCSCQAGVFGRKCWAQERVTFSPFSNVSNKLYVTPEEFDRKKSLATAQNS